MGSFDLTVAWAAGFIDGEGFLDLVPIYRKEWKGYTVTVRVNQVDPRPLQKLKLYFGGQINPIKVVGNRRQAWEWRVVSQQAATLLSMISPFLVNKSEQATLLLEARSYLNHSQENISRLDEINQELKELRHKNWEPA